MYLSPTEWVDLSPSYSPMSRSGPPGESREGSFQQSLHVGWQVQLWQLVSPGSSYLYLKHRDSCKLLMFFLHYSGGGVVEVPDSSHLSQLAAVANLPTSSQFAESNSSVSLLPAPGGQRSCEACVIM